MSMSDVEGGSGLAHRSQAPAFSSYSVGCVSQPWSSRQAWLRGAAHVGASGGRDLVFRAAMRAYRCCLYVWSMFEQRIDKPNQGLARFILPEATVKKAAVAISVVGFLLLFVAGDKKYVVTSITICLCGLLFGNHLSGSVLLVLVLVLVLPISTAAALSLVDPASLPLCVGVTLPLGLASYVLSADEGSDEMRRVSDPIRQGAEGATTMCASSSHIRCPHTSCVWHRFFEGSVRSHPQVRSGSCGFDFLELPISAIHAQWAWCQLREPVAHGRCRCRVLSPGTQCIHL